MCVGFFRTGLLLFWVFECFHLFVWAPQEFSRKGWRGKGGGVGTFGLKKKKIMVSFVTKQYPPSKKKKTKKLAPPFKKTDRNHGNRIFILRVRNVSFWNHRWLEVGRGRQLAWSLVTRLRVDRPGGAGDVSPPTLRSIGGKPSKTR